MSILSSPAADWEAGAYSSLTFPLKASIPPWWELRSYFSRPGTILTSQNRTCSRM